MIREVLQLIQRIRYERRWGGNGYEIKKQDGTVAQSGTLLPSAFFKVKKAGNIFKIIGGGYGHGIGMSQNGANEMAKKREELSGNITNVLSRNNN